MLRWQRCPGDIRGFIHLSPFSQYPRRSVHLLRCYFYQRDSAETAVEFFLFVLKILARSIRQDKTRTQSIKCIYNIEKNVSRRRKDIREHLSLYRRVVPKIPLHFAHSVILERGGSFVFRSPINLTTSRLRSRFPARSRWKRRLAD